MTSSNSRLIDSGVYAGFTISVLFVTVGFLFAFIGPRLGIATYDDMLVAEKVLPVIQNSPGLVTVYLLGAAVSACILVLALAANSVLCDAAPTKSTIALHLAVIHIVLTLAADLPRLLSLPYLAEHFEREPQVASTVFLSVSLVLSGLNVAARMVFGAWILMLCWTGLTTRLFRPGVCITGMAVGLVHTACLLLPFPPVADIAWFPFLALAIKQAKPTDSYP